MAVLVTGATGHIGNTLCRILSEEQQDIRAMVRSTSDLTPVRDLDVQTVEANLLNPASLEHALEDCEVVYHTAAVYKLWSPNPELDIIKPAVEGTRHLFEAARNQDVRKIVYVSSVSAIGSGDNFEHNLTTENWNTEASSPYNIAKTRSEQLAHELAGSYDIPTIFVLPTMVLGPYDYKITPSTSLVRDFLLGKLRFTYRGAYSVTDCRDVVHGLLLAERYGTPGKRYILGGTQVTIEELFTQLAEMTTVSAPRFGISKQIAHFIAHPTSWFASLLGTEPLFTPEAVESTIGKYYNFPSTLAEEELGYSYRSLMRVLEDTINWLIQRNEIPQDIRVVENA